MSKKGPMSVTGNRRELIEARRWVRTVDKMRLADKKKALLSRWQAKG